MCPGYEHSSQKIYHGQEISQKYLLPLAIREIIIKTILRFTLPQSEWQRLKNKSKQSATTNVRGGLQKRGPSFALGEISELCSHNANQSGESSKS